jgi:hypothetical protein
VIYLYRLKSYNGKYFQHVLKIVVCFLKVCYMNVENTFCYVIMFTVTLQGALYKNLFDRFVAIL